MEKETLPNNGEIVIYTSADGAVQTEVCLVSESLWLSLNQIAAFFERDKSVISRHLRNVFEEKELTKYSVVAKYATTASSRYA